MTNFQFAVVILAIVLIATVAIMAISVMTAPELAEALRAPNWAAVAEHQGAKP